MITSSMFDKLEILTRSVLNQDLPFGGIQLVITGDFLQLPPGILSILYYYSE